MIGVAAHICAAAPGGRRYDPTITPEQRSSIENGIWLCQTHSAVIDRDEVTYPADRLREMKLRHERSRSFDPNAVDSQNADDIIALGPNIIGVGAFIAAGPTGWKLRLKHFVKGDPLELVGYASDFDRLAPEERYVLVNELGDGRTLTAAPSLERKGNEYDLILPIASGFPRIRADALGSMMAVSRDTGDVFAENGRIAIVSGIDAFAQHLQHLLGLARGENIFHPRSGTLISQFYRDFAHSRWLDRLIKMEVIRLAAIPYEDQLLKSTQTPLRCVNRVREVEVLADGLTNQRLPLRVVLDVEGTGIWERLISIFIHTDEQLDGVASRQVPPWLAGALR